MKTSKIILETIKCTDGWAELIWDLRYDKFVKDHPELSELDDDGEKLTDTFHEENTYLFFEHGEFADLELIFDEDLNIIGGKILKFKEQ